MHERDEGEGLVLGLFAREVPEVASGVVEIRAIARSPGFRTKIAVASNDAAVDPVGACVGHGGERVGRVAATLGGESIDIIPWTDSPDRAIRFALAPMRVHRVELDPESRRARVHGSAPGPELGRLPEGHLTLASRLTGWDITIASSDRRD